MNTELKDLFLKRFDFMTKLVSMYDSHDSLTNFDLKQACTIFTNELEYRQAIENIIKREKYYDYQNELISDIDTLSYVLMGEDYKNKWIQLVEQYSTQITKEHFDKLSNKYNKSITDINSFIGYILDCSNEQSDYFTVLTDNTDTKKTMFYCFVLMYVDLVYKDIIIPCETYMQALNNILKLNDTLDERMINKPNEKMINKFDEKIMNKFDEKIMNKFDEKIMNKFDERMINKFDERMRGSNINEQTDMLGILIQSFKTSKLFISEL
jgi:hypothetical protein